MMHRAPMPQPEFKPGQLVPGSGIYHIEHWRDHRQSHEVVFARNDKFPECEICGHAVRYTLLRAAPFVFEDPDFRDTQEEEKETRAEGNG
jgi:hypothetical protein